MNKNHKRRMGNPRRETKTQRKHRIANFLKKEAERQQYKVSQRDQNIQMMRATL